MKGHGAKFGRKMEGAIAALVTHRNTEEAARAAGVSPKTLSRWLQLPEFQKAYLEARRLAYRQTTARLQQASGAAVTTLLKTMVDSNAPAASRVRAAGYVLDHAARAMEIEDVEVRLAALEQAAEKASEEQDS